MLKKIILVFKTHVDIGFTDLPDKVIASYRTAQLDQVLDRCYETSSLKDGDRFVWTLPSWLVKDILEHADQKRRERFIQAIKNRQIKWHGLPFTTHTEFCSIREFIHGLEISKQLDATYDTKTTAAKMTDVPGHTWMTPSLLHTFGIHFLHLGCNACSSSPETPELFWWQGPDSRRILTWYSEDYGTALLPPDDWQYETWMALMQTHDNCGPQNKQTMEQLKERIYEKYPNVEVTIGTMDDFANAMLKEDLSQLDVLKYDLSDTWIHGVGTYPQEVSQIRSLREQLHTYEMTALSDFLTEKETPEETDTIWDNLLLFSEHTWGLDIKTSLLKNRNGTRCFLKDDVLTDRKRFPDSYEAIEASWHQKRRYLSEALNAFKAIEERTDKALLEASKREKPKQANAIWRVQETSKQIVMENPYLSVVIDRSTGKMHSIYDKKRKMEWLSGSVEACFGRYRYRRFGRNEIKKCVFDYGKDLVDWYVNDFGKPGYPIQATYESTVQCVHVELVWDSDKATVIMRFDHSHDLKEHGDFKESVVEMVMHRNQPVLDFTFKFTGKNPTLLAEAGTIAFETGRHHVQHKIQKMGVTVNPLDQVPRGGDCQKHCLDQWMYMQSNQSVLGIIPLDSPLVSLGASRIYKYDSNKPASIGPRQYVELFNNQWGTNFPQWIEGDITSRIRVVIEGEDRIDSKMNHYTQSFRGLEKRIGFENNVAQIQSLFGGLRFVGCSLQDDGKAMQVYLQNPQEKHALYLIQRELDQVRIMDLAEKEKHEDSTMFELKCRPFEIKVIRMEKTQ